MHKESRETTKKRHNIVLNVYNEIIKKHGIYASRLQKADLYCEVSCDPRVAYSELTVGNIIRAYLKHEGCNR